MKKSISELNYNELLNYVNNNDLSDSEKDKVSIKYKLNKINRPKNNEEVGVAVVYLDNTIVKEEKIYIKVKNKLKKESIFKRILNIFK